MGKINSYALAPSPVSGSDKLIGTDTTNNNATKNFTINQLISFIGLNGGFVPYTGATENVNLGSQVLYATGGIFYGTIQATNVNAIGGLLINSNAGTSGQVLVSQGTGVPPIWSSSIVTGAQGVQGPVGPTGPVGPVGPAGLTWRSSWVAGTSYILNDAVGYAGASWFCILATSGTTPPDINTTNWALLASQGAQGPAGATGAQGPTGATGATGATGVSGNNTLQQVLDLNHALVDGNNYQGTLAGLSNTGININAFGSGSAQGNIGDGVNALGYQAGLSNTGFFVNALGDYSATSNSGYNVNAFGNSAAISNSGSNVNAFGPDAGTLNSYNNVNLFGYNASATAQDQTVFAGGSFMARLGYGSITADRLYAFPDASGTLALTKYKVYTGIINTNSLTLDILENTLGVNLAPTNPSNGVIRFTAASGTPFTAAKTFIIVKSSIDAVGDAYFVTAKQSNVFPTTIIDFTITKYDNTRTFTPNLSGGMHFEIRVYP